jgi:GTPase Era involved in 16S rRNA processing
MSYLKQMKKLLTMFRDILINDPHVADIKYISQLEAYEASKELVGEEIMEELGHDFLPHPSL